MHLTRCDRCSAEIKRDRDFSEFTIWDPISPQTIPPNAPFPNKVHLCGRCRSVFDLFLKAGKP